MCRKVQRDTNVTNESEEERSRKVTYPVGMREVMRKRAALCKEKGRRIQLRRYTDEAKQNHIDYCAVVDDDSNGCELAADVDGIFVSRATVDVDDDGDGSDDGEHCSSVIDRREK